MVGADVLLRETFRIGAWSVGWDILLIPCSSICRGNRFHAAGVVHPSLYYRFVALADGSHVYVHVLHCWCMFFVIHSMVHSWHSWRNFVYMVPVAIRFVFIIIKSVLVMSPWPTNRHKCWSICVYWKIIKHILSCICVLGCRSDKVVEDDTHERYYTESIHKYHQVLVHLYAIHRWSSVGDFDETTGSSLLVFFSICCTFGTRLENPLNIDLVGWPIQWIVPTITSTEHLYGRLLPAPQKKISSYIEGVVWI